MNFKRKKLSIIKRSLGAESILWLVCLFFSIYVIVCPERYNLELYLFLDRIYLGRTGGALVPIILALVLTPIVLVIYVKETRWNNKHLNLPVIEINGEELIINNYKQKETIKIEDITNLTIMNKDSVLEFKTKDNKIHHADSLEDNRKAYEFLKEYMGPINKNIVFEDSSAKKGHDH